MTTPALKYFYVYREAGWAFHVGNPATGARCLQNGFPTPSAAIEGAQPFLALCDITGPGELHYGGFVGRFVNDRWTAAPPDGTRCLPVTAGHVDQLRHLIDRELKRVEKLGPRKPKPRRKAGAHEEESE